MKHIAFSLAAVASLACAGCSTVPGGFDLADAGGQVASAVFQRIKDDPSAPFCVANAANLRARRFVQGGARQANLTAGAVTRQLCLALGGKPSSAPPVNAVPAAAVASNAS